MIFKYEFSLMGSEYTRLQSTIKHSWAVNMIQLEKPQYVIFFLQTGRKNIMFQDVMCSTIVIWRETISKL